MGKRGNRWNVAMGSVDSISTELRFWLSEEWPCSSVSLLHILGVTWEGHCSD